MNISTKLKDEHIDPEKPSSGYEWWYFDGLSFDKQWSFVIIFYEGNPFSPRYIEALRDEEATPDQFPAISISVYHKDKPEYYSFVEYKPGSFHWNEEEGSARIGSNFFQWKQDHKSLEYRLLIAQQLDSNHSIQANLLFKSTELSEGLIEHSSDDRHFWNLLQPRAEVTGSIILEGRRDHSVLFNGVGYHDHNTGYEPLKDSFEDWYWGRIHFPQYTLVYYIMNGLNGKQQHEAWLISKEEQIISRTFENLELSDFSKTKLGLNSARSIRLGSGDTSITLNQSRVLDNGPFYQRFLADATLTDQEGSFKAKGITEYIKPDRIYEEKYWWMVRMRLRFLSQKPHWVQRSKMLYQWTW
ncbi:MAG: hypothetical protein ED557_01095 [Balneola sp.]|nr:MAG: hypothetical protein ED557_01095 [Balneola sp.]